MGDINVKADLSQVIKTLQSIQPTAIEYELFRCGFVLTPKQARALLHARDSKERAEIISAAASASTS